MPGLRTYEYADGAALVAGLPRHAGTASMDTVNDWIKATEMKMMPYYIEEKFTAITSGLAKRETDNVAVRIDKCHGELAAPNEYVCAPADNCAVDEMPLEKTVIQKDKTLTKNLSFDPVCDDDTLMEINRAGGAEQYADLKMKGIAYAFAKAENQAIFDVVSASSGVIAGNEPAYAINNWDADNVVEEFNCLLAKLADNFGLDVTELMVFGNHTLASVPRVAGAHYNDSGAHNSFRDNYGMNSGAYQFDFQGVPFYADNHFPSGKMFIGLPGSFTYWDSPTYYDQRETGCNHGINHIWTKKYNVYNPCDMANKFAVVDIAGLTCA